MCSGDALIRGSEFNEVLGRPYGRPDWYAHFCSHNQNKIF